MARNTKPRVTRKNQRGSRNRAFDAVLSRTVVAGNKGQKVEMTAESAFLLQLRNRSRSLKDDSASELLADAQAELAEVKEFHEPVPGGTNHIIVSFPAHGSIGHELELLRMATKFDRLSEQSYLKIEPWLVQAAVDRLATDELTIDQQRTVLDATRTPHKVKWPLWWKAAGGA